MYETPRKHLNLIQNPNSSWYFRRFLEVKDYPERFPNWKIIYDKLYYFGPDPILSILVQDLNEWKLVPSDDERKIVLSEAHNEPQAGHLGTENTYKRIAMHYYWPGCFQDTVKYVKNCDICQMCKVEQKTPPSLMGRRVIEAPWTVVAADIMGFHYILVIQDLFTKWVEIVPLRKATGKKIRDSFQELIINRWGTPRVIHTDNGTEFINNILRSLAQEFNIVHTTSPPYHPLANPIERVNRVTKTMIVSYINNDQRTWDEHLSNFRFAFNTAYHSSLKTSPAFLNFGRDPIPINLLHKPKGNIDLNIESKTIESWNERMKKILVMKD